MEKLNTQSSIRTFTGKYIDVLNPNPDAIDIIDIVHGLSHVCRFAGHTPAFYSVAQHSVLVSYAEMPDNLKLAALLHDASEAYLGDVPTPIKKQLPEYQRMENRLMLAIATKFNITLPINPLIKHVDKLVMEWEWNSLILKQKGIQPIKPLQPGNARTLFLECFKKYTK